MPILILILCLENSRPNDMVCILKTLLEAASRVGNRTEDKHK